MRAVASRLSENVILISRPPSTTWLLVRRYPSVEMTTPARRVLCGVWGSGRYKNCRYGAVCTYNVDEMLTEARIARAATVVRSGSPEICDVGNGAGRLR